MPKLTLDQALCGVLPPLITPVHEDQSLDEEGFLRQLRRCLEAGCSGAFVNGSSGEGPWLTTAQRRRTVELAVKAGTVVIAGVMLPGTAMAIEAALDAERAGAHAVVVSAPYYFSCEGATIIRHVEAVAAAVNVPVILYNIPQCTHNLLTASLVGHLAADPRVVGIKDSSGDVELFKSHLATRERYPFRVLQGAEQVMGDSLRWGADGLVPGTGNVAPGLFVRLLRTVRDRDEKAAHPTEQTIAELQRIYTIAPGFAAMKAAVSAFGACGRTTVAPQAPATDEQMRRIADVLHSAGLIAPATVH